MTGNEQSSDESYSEDSDLSLTPTVFTGSSILCYGDSLTAGYCTPRFVPYATMLSEALGQPVDHAGLCGWTTEDMVRQKDTEVCNKVCGLVYPGLVRLVQSNRSTYKVVLLMAGTNDLGGRASAAVITSNLEKLHRLCHEAGARTVALTIPQSAFATDKVKPGRINLRKKQLEVNALLQQFAAANEDRCLFVDMESKVPWSPGSEDWMSDGLHMSQKGYEKFGRLLAPLISDFVSKQSPVQKHVSA